MLFFCVFVADFKFNFVCQNNQNVDFIFLKIDSPILTEYKKSTEEGTIKLFGLRQKVDLRQEAETSEGGLKGGIRNMEN